MKKIMVFVAMVTILTTLTGCSVTLGHDEEAKSYNLEETLKTNKERMAKNFINKEEVITEDVIEENIIAEKFIDEEYEEESEYNSQTNEY